MIRPMVLASASSSKGLRSSKNFSTDEAVSVPSPKSTSSAPNDRNLLGILMTPVATPANADSMKPVPSAFHFLAVAVGPRASASVRAMYSSYFVFFGFTLILKPAS